MPRRSLLTDVERSTLMGVPTTESECAARYTFTSDELLWIEQRRGAYNRLGFAVHLYYLRCLGRALPPGVSPPPALVSVVAEQIGVKPQLWENFSRRAETRREHLTELQARLGLVPFGLRHFRKYVRHLAILARQTDRGIVLATQLVDMLRKDRVIIPAVDVIDRVCANALTRGAEQVWQALTAPLSEEHKRVLDGLLTLREGSSISSFAWLLQPPGSAVAKRMLTHIERLNTIRAIALPEELEQSVHQNRLIKLAREGARMTAQHLRDLEETRRYATLVAVLFDTRASVTDEIIDMHNRMLGSQFNRAKRRHAERFHEAGKEINASLRLYMRIGRALIDAKELGTDAFSAIEAVLPWNDFAQSVADAEQLAQPEEFDHLPLLSDAFAPLRRYTPEFLSVLQFDASPAVAEILQAVNVLKEMNEQKKRKVPGHAPVGFISKRWRRAVYTNDGIDRRFYELCVLSELSDVLRSGDVWVQGSRRYKDFDRYLLSIDDFEIRRKNADLRLAVDTDCERYLEERLGLLEQELAAVGALAAADELPDALITDKGLKITPLKNAVPKEAKGLVRLVGTVIPRLKITDLLLEVNAWTGFARHFTHLRSGDSAADSNLLLTVILADGINLGLSKMADACPGSTYAKLCSLQAWFIREETYAAALAELVNAQHNHPFAARWGDGSASASDGQRFRTGSHGAGVGHVNAKYGDDPGVTFYTHVSDQYSPYHTQVIYKPARDATFTLDGLLNHESHLEIAEHYTDTSGFTDHVFALMHFFGIRFIPRIRDLGTKNLYVPRSAKQYASLAPLIGGTINVRHIKAHWDDVLRLTASMKHGTVTPSLIVGKLAAYPRQNGLAVAVRELGRIERTLHILDLLKSVDPRRRSQVGLNKNEAEHSLAQALFFNRLGELRFGQTKKSSSRLSSKMASR